MLKKLQKLLAQYSNEIELKGKELRLLGYDPMERLYYTLACIKILVNKEINPQNKEVEKVPDEKDETIQKDNEPEKVTKETKAPKSPSGSGGGKESKTKK